MGNRRALKCHGLTMGAILTNLHAAYMSQMAGSPMQLGGGRQVGASKNALSMMSMASLHPDPQMAAAAAAMIPNQLENQVIY